MKHKTKKRRNQEYSKLQILKQLKLPLMLLTMIALVLFFGNALPLEAKQFIYALSLTIKNILLTLLPFLIIIFISSSLILLEGRVISFVVSMIIVICISNYFAVIFSYFFAGVALSFLPQTSSAIIDVSSNSLQPLWDSKHYALIRNELGILIGLVFGLFFSIKRNKPVHDLLANLQRLANNFLKYCFIPVLPFFIAGFLIKLEHEGLLGKVIQAYAPIFVMFVLSQAVYVVLLLLTVSKCNINSVMRYIKNTIPATITGFSTLSSAATMPVTIVAAEKNSGMSNISKMVIPATVNIHLVGTSIGMNILILGTMLTFTNQLPDFLQYAYFGVFFAITQFAAVGVPGGVIFSVIPLLEGQLGFTPEMIGIVSTLVMLFDPVDTSFNVTINALFAVIFGGVYSKLKASRA